MPTSDYGSPMCNLYSVQSSAAEIAVHFGVSDPPALEIPGQIKQDGIKPGEPGIIVRQGAGRRVMQSLRWGFPRPQTDRDGNPLHLKPVNLVADLTNPMWDKMVPDPRYRCLIPVTAFAQPEGPRGRMTRTWFSVRDWPIFAWAGFCRRNEEWGPVYSGAMADCNEAIRPLHDRMPVLLHPHEYEQWLRGSFEDLLAFQKRRFPDDLIEIQPTSELWVKKKAPASSEAPSLL
jgi:putative SOS response-associated peptidase YedK